MKKQLALATLVFSLASGALACPVKAGSIANGLLKNTAKTTPICGPLYLAFRQSLAGAKWTEMYALETGAAGDRRADGILAALQKQGYRQVRVKKTARSRVYLYQRGKASITALVGISGAVHYLALAGQ